MVTTIPAARRTAHDTTTRNLLYCGYLPAAFLLVILVEGALRPGYDALHHMGSELSLSDRGWIQITNFVVTGLGTIAFALGARRATPTGPASTAFPLLTALLGLGLVSAGVFVSDPNAGYPPGVATLDAPTWHGWLHNLNIVPVWAALTAAIAVVAYRAARHGELRWAAVCLTAAVLTPATMMISASQFDMDTFSGSYHGLWQRVSMGVGFGWYALHTTRLLTRAEASRWIESSAGLGCSRV